MIVTEHEPKTRLDEETRQALLRAKGTLANGWCQGDYRDGQGRYCVLGALDYEVPSKAGKKAIDALNEALGGHISLGTWNDMPGRTVEDVIGFIDRVLQQ
jgi:hypothetical protein